MTTYKKNTFSSNAEGCPFCGEIPKQITHIIFYCCFIQDLWKQLLPFLNLIHPTPLTEYEMVFGLTGRAPSIILRNWLTFNLRHVISNYEYVLYKSHSQPSLSKVKARFNQQVKSPILWKHQYYTHVNNLPFFKKHFQFTPYLVDETAEELDVAEFFFI